MVRQPPRRHQHDIEAEIRVAEIGPSRQELRQGALDPAALLPQQRLGAACPIAARLDLDRGNDVPAPDDEIDLADRAR